LACQREFVCAVQQSVAFNPVNGVGRAAEGKAGIGLLECRAMKRRMHVALALLAALMHLGAPIAAYAKATHAVTPGDFCSAARGATTARTDQGSPRPSSEHRCAHAPCCAGGAPDSAALPPHVPVVFSAPLLSVRAPSSRPEALPPAPIAAAQPRGPPAHT
jgi:hypothetical protein